MKFRFFLPLLLVGLALNADAGCPRIVSQSPYLTIAIDWLGRGQCIVGVSRYDKRDLPKTGGIIDPDAEAIAALHPTLIVGSQWTKPGTQARITPPGARTVTFGGFDSLPAVSRMLKQLAGVVGASGGNAKVAAFDAAWHKKVGEIPGRHRRVLLVSACSGAPYTFGGQHLVGDIFARSGFTLVEPDTKIHHLTGLDALDDLVDQTRPDLVVSFTPETADFCQVIGGRFPVKTINLNGANFFHPGPRLLDALNDLAAKVAL